MQHAEMQGREGMRGGKRIKERDRNKTRRMRRQKLTVCRHARTRPKGMRLWIGNEPRHKTRGIRGFILFHSILHGRQPPREYGIKLLHRLTKDDEIEAAEKTGVVDIGKFPRPKGGTGPSTWGDTFRITKWRTRAAIKYRLLPIRMRARISYVSTEPSLTLLCYVCRSARRLLSLRRILHQTFFYARSTDLLQWRNCKLTLVSIVIKRKSNYYLDKISADC